MPAARGLAVGSASDADQPAGGLQDEIHGRFVARWPVLSIARDRAIHQLGIALARGLESQPEPFHGAGAVVFEQNVGPLRQTQAQLDTLETLQIYRHAAFAGVDTHKERGLIASERRPPAASNIAAARRLHLVHVRS